MPLASPEDIALIESELNTAWLAYSDHVEVRAEDVEAKKQNLARIITSLWSEGQTEGLAESALLIFTSQ